MKYLHCILCHHHHNRADGPEGEIQLPSSPVLGEAFLDVGKEEPLPSGASAPPLAQWHEQNGVSNEAEDGGEYAPLLITRSIEGLTGGEPPVPSVGN